MAPSSISPKADVVSDRQLIAQVRGGDMEAYNGLYARHQPIASAVANQNLDNPSDTEDVVAEAFQSVLKNLVDGKGPEQFFRAYLLSAVTRIAHHRNRIARRTFTPGNEALLEHKLTPDDPAIQAFESETIARAFRSLPERWQAVLWYLDVERMKPAAVAPILGLSPNNVSSLGIRAREGLRRKYLQMHISQTPQGACTGFASQLGSYVRGGLSKPAEAKVRAHLDGCAKCTALLLELEDVQRTMRAVLLPLITGVPLAVWDAKAAGLGIVGNIPHGASILAGMKPALMLPLTAALGVGLVFGTIGIIEILTADPEPGTYQEPNAQTTRPADQMPTPATTPDPTPMSTTAPPDDPAAGEATATPEPSPAQTTAPAPLIPHLTPVTTPKTFPAPPSPISSPPLAQVSGTAIKRDSGTDQGTPTVEVVFSLSRADGLGNATADFSVDHDASIDRGSISAPAGWTCMQIPADPSRLHCVTDSAHANDLRFRLKVVAPDNWNEGTLAYGLSGTGIAAQTFRMHP